jgi:hypothetical protein
LFFRIIWRFIAEAIINDGFDLVCPKYGKLRKIQKFSGSYVITDSDLTKTELGQLYLDYYKIDKITV